MGSVCYLALQTSGAGHVETDAALRSWAQRMTTRDWFRAIESRDEHENSTANSVLPVRVYTVKIQDESTRLVRLQSSYVFATREDETVKLLDERSARFVREIQLLHLQAMPHVLRGRGARQRCDAEGLAELENSLLWCASLRASKGFNCRMRKEQGRRVEGPE